MSVLFSATLTIIPPCFRFVNKFFHFFYIFVFLDFYGYFMPSGKLSYLLPGSFIVDYSFPDKLRGFQTSHLFSGRLRGFQTSPCASSLWSPLRGFAAKLMLGICLKACQVFGVLDSRYTTRGLEYYCTYFPTINDKKLIIH